MQEGWRYELEKEEDPITVTGVVYNEMLGVFASPEEYLGHLSQSGLFPNNPYHFDSGGVPDDILTLQWENFLQFHKEHYHPSNSYTILYGNGILEEELAILDEYFGEYSFSEPSPCISFHEHITKRNSVCAEYPIGDSEDEAEKTYLSLSWQIGNTWDTELMLALEALEHILLNAQAAILKGVLLKAGVGKDVSGSVDEDLAQPYFSVVVKGSEESRALEFQAIVQQELSRVVAEGLPKDLVEGALNKLEFLLREADFKGYPKGVIYGMTTMQTWLYDKDPLLPLRWEEPLMKIKKLVLCDGIRYFEELIGKHILNNTHSCLVILKPKKGMEAAKKQALSDSLAKFKKSMSKDQINALIEQTCKFKELQEAEDTPEEIATIPVLSISDVEKKAEELPIRVSRVPFQDIQIPSIEHELQTNGILYSRLLFDFSWIPVKQLPLVTLLCFALGKLNTAHTDYKSLDNKININSGGLSLRTQVSSQRFSDDKFAAVVSVMCKFLPTKAYLHILSSVTT